MKKAAVKNVLVCSLLVTMLTPCLGATPPDRALETISISADEASEDVRPGVLHFKGHFMMQSDDWELMAAQATVYGSPDQPDRVHLEGSPARFLIRRDDKAGQGPIEATAAVVEYLRSGNSLTLSGGAMLVLDDEVIRSASIEYDIDARRYSAGGLDGVLIQVPGTD